MGRTLGEFARTEDLGYFQNSPDHLAKYGYAACDSDQNPGGSHPYKDANYVVSDDLADLIAVNKFLFKLSCNNRNWLVFLHNLIDNGSASGVEVDL